MSQTNPTDEPTVEQLAKRIDELEQRQEQLRSERDTVNSLIQQFAAGKISRRTFMTTVSAVAGGAWMIGRARAAPNWSNASGKQGTDSDPLVKTVAQTGRFQTVNADEAIISGATYDNNKVVETQALGIKASSDQTITSTSNNRVSDGDGWIDLGNLPSGATVVGRFVGRMKNDTSNETTYAVPQLFDTTVSTITLSELEISVTSTNFTLADSGWTEITSIPLDDIYAFDSLQGRVSNGTGTYDRRWGLIVGVQL